MAKAAAQRGTNPSSRNMLQVIFTFVVLTTCLLPLRANAMSTSDSVVIPSITVSGATNNAPLLGKYARTAKVVTSTNSPVWELMGQNDLFYIAKATLAQGQYWVLYSGDWWDPTSSTSSIYFAASKTGTASPLSSDTTWSTGPTFLGKNPAPTVANANAGNATCDEICEGTPTKYMSSCVSNCLTTCNGYGKVGDDGTCACQDGWMTDSGCSIFCDNAVTCAHPNSDVKCNPDGTCDCHGNGYVGLFCDFQCSPGQCGTHGSCNATAASDQSICSCSNGWFGNECQCNDQETCSGHGKCVVQNCGNTECECDEGYTGTSCQVSCPPEKCSGHGKCNPSNGECICNAGWVGASTGCKYQCDDVTDCGSPAGSCKDDGTCECTCGYHTIDEGLPCRFHNDTCGLPGEGGFCSDTSRGCCGADGGCDCAYGFAGPNCSYAAQTCETGLCSGHGECLQDKTNRFVNCSCYPGFSGKRCAGCSNHGHFDTATGKCKCDDGYAGSRCQIDQEVCDRQTCNGRGRCLDCEESVSVKSATKCSEGLSQAARLEPRCNCQWPWEGTNCLHVTAVALAVSFSFLTVVSVSFSVYYLFYVYTPPEENLPSGYAEFRELTRQGQHSWWEKLFGFWMGCFLYFLSFIWLYKCLLTCCNCVKPKGEAFDDSDDENDDLFWDSSNQSSPKDPSGGGGGGGGFESAESQSLAIRQPGQTYGGVSRGPAAYMPPRNTPTSGVVPYQSPGKNHKNYFVKKGHKVSQSGTVDANEFRVGGEFGAAVKFPPRQRRAGGGGGGGASSYTKL